MSALNESEHEDARLKQFETDVVLRDGSIVHVRPVHSDDRMPLASFVEELSPETLGLRFLHVLQTEKMVKELIPAPNQFALLATRDEKVIGHAIYTVTSPDKVEHALVVLRVDGSAADR